MDAYSIVQSAENSTELFATNILTDQPFRSPVNFGEAMAMAQGKIYTFG